MLIIIKKVDHYVFTKRESTVVLRIFFYSVRGISLPPLIHIPSKSPAVSVTTPFLTYVYSAVTGGLMSLTVQNKDLDLDLVHPLICMYSLQTAHANTRIALCMLDVCQICGWSNLTWSPWHQLVSELRHRANQMSTPKSQTRSDISAMGRELWRIPVRNSFANGNRYHVIAWDFDVSTFPSPLMSEVVSVYI